MLSSDDITRMACTREELTTLKMAARHMKRMPESIFLKSLSLDYRGTALDYVYDSSAFHLDAILSNSLSSSDLVASPFTLDRDYFLFLRSNDRRLKLERLLRCLSPP